MKHLISIVGPTGIGKTSLSLVLAQAFSTEIISTDSRQLYQEMQIGTACPTPQELELIPHHFIHSHSIHQDYTVGDYERDALEQLTSLFQKHEVVMAVGGSGLYEKALLEGLDDFPDVPKSIRTRVRNLFSEKGIAALQQEIKALDPMYYAEADIHNPQRMMRALEVCWATGKPFSSYRNQTAKERSFKAIRVGLQAPREEMYHRINQRVDTMMDQGLLDEVQSLLPYKHLNALQTVGYKELFDYFEGIYRLEDALEEIKKYTRRFAKRQLTWYNKSNDIQWFDYKTPYAEITTYLRRLVE